MPLTVGAIAEALGAEADGDLTLAIRSVAQPDQAGADDLALAMAVERMLQKKQIAENPLHGQIAAVSVGVYNGQAVLDLDYAEDSSAETDMNVVMNEAGGFIEVQGTAEGHAFRRDELDAMLNLAAAGIGEITQAQNTVLYNWREQQG